MTDNRTTELLCCPFCGGEAELRDDGETDFPFIVQCVECGGMTCGHRHADTPFGAIAAWNTRVDYHGYEQAAIEAWESIKAWNTRAERTCRNIAEPDEMSSDPFTCSECGARGPYGDGIYHIGGSREVDGKLVFWDSWPVYKFCPNCGARVIGTEAGE